MVNKELYHHGVLGMKWGVRKVRGNSSSTGNASKHGSSSKSNNPDAAKNKKKSSKKESVKDLSDDELRRRVARLQMEQQYARLNPKQVSLGKRFIKSMANDILVPAAKEVGKNVAKNLMEEQIKNITDKPKKK